MVVFFLLSLGLARRMLLIGNDLKIGTFFTKGIYGMCELMLVKKS